MSCLDIPAGASASSTIAFAFLLREVACCEVGDTTKERFVGDHVMGTRRSEWVFFSSRLIQKDSRRVGSETVLPSVIRNARALRSRVNEVDSDWNVCHVVPIELFSVSRPGSLFPGRVIHSGASMEDYPLRKCFMRLGADRTDPPLCPVVCG